jgi:hypothetical protein
MLGFLIFFTFFFTVVGSVVFFGVYSTSERFHCWVREMCGEDIIIIEDERGESWCSYVEISPINGKRIAYRYPTSKIGAVTLEPDGTGYYHGRIAWRLKSAM